jgi:hypothetical protein
MSTVPSMARYCLAARIWASMTARVATRFLFFACVSMHQSGQSSARNSSSSVKITKAAQWPQMEGSPGFGRVDLLRDQRSECLHSGHSHVDVLWRCIGVRAP